MVGSSIARETHAGAYTHAGPEIGVASTKAFTTQITVLSLMALHLAKANGTLDNNEFKTIVNELELIPQKVEVALLANDKIKEFQKPIYKRPTACSWAVG